MGLSIHIIISKKLKTFFINCFHVKTVKTRVKTIRVCRNYVPSIQKEGSVDTRHRIHVSGTPWAIVGESVCVLYRGHVWDGRAELVLEGERHGVWQQNRTWTAGPGNASIYVMFCIGREHWCVPSYKILVMVMVRLDLSFFETRH